MTAPFDGLGLHLGNLSRLSPAESRSISPENPTGERGGGARATTGVASAAAAVAGLGPGWKISPYVKIGPGTTFTLADIAGSGAIQSIWMTPTGHWRWLILRIYWDDCPEPSVECPVGDFFACGWGRYAQVSSLAVCVNPGSAFNCYWEMSFRRRCRIELANLAEAEVTLYYQINYTLTAVPADAAYFHAQFRRVNPVPAGEVCTILDGPVGPGQYAGTYLAWGSNSSGWWGEGEVKFYLDDDGEHPTICGTGTEDYFGGSYNFDVGRENGGYREFTTPYSGLPQVIRPDENYQSQQRFGLYRWHIMDPVRFRSRLRVTVQALGWNSRRAGYQLLQDDIASVAFWYQAQPSRLVHPLPSRAALEVV